MASATLETVQQQLGQVESEIEDAVAELIQSIQTVDVAESSSEEDAIKTNLDTLNELWVIKSAVQELESLESLGELSIAFSQLEEFKTRLQRFAGAHPSALLIADLERKSTDIAKRLRQQLEENWRNAVSVNKTEKSIEMNLAVSPEVYETARDFMPTLIEDFLVALSPVFEAIINLQVHEVFESETSVEFSYNSGDLDVAMLIDVVQTFVLAIGGVLAPVPELQARIARRYGHNMVENLVHKSFPNLFPEQSENLHAFKKDIEGVRGLEDVMLTEGWVKSHELSSFANSFDNQWNLSRNNYYLAKLRESLAGEYKVDSWDWDGEDFGDDDGFDEEPESKEKALDIFQAFLWETDLPVDSLLAVFRALAPAFYRKHPMTLYVETMYILAEVSNAPARPKSLELTEMFANQLLADILAENAASLDRELYAIKIDATYSPSAVKSVMDKLEQIAQTASSAGPQIREHVISQAVEQVVTYLIRSVEAIEDISETESINISTTINEFRGCAAFFENVAVSVPSWVKLQRLTAIVSGRLDDIADLTASGQLSDFSAVELESLITALFVDSDHRQQVLDLVYRVCG